MRRRSVLIVLAAAAGALSVPTPAAAAVPTVVWTAPGMSGVSFSVDGTLALLVGNGSAGGRLEVRRAGTGAAVQAVTSPFKFGAATLSADNQIAAVTLADTSSGSVVQTIRLYRVADGSLLRAIPTAATRDLTSVDLSPDGRLVAAMDRRSYEQGGRIHVHRVSDGSTATVLTAPATTATVRFSPDGRYLAANDRFTVAGRFLAGVRVFRTADWASVLAVSDGSLLLRWSRATSGIWTTTVAYGVPTGARLIAVPDATTARSVVLAEYDTVSDVSDNDALILTGRWAAPRRSLKFAASATGTAVATYDFSADVFAGDISPDGTLFSYALTVAPSSYHVYVARMPG